jgi:2'-5' RNA ligase
MADSRPTDEPTSHTPEQFSLPGFDTPAKPTDRLFFAIFPPMDVATRIAQLAEQLRGEHQMTGKPITAKRFHITLHHLGDYVGLPADVVAMASDAAATVTMPSFEIEFDHAMSFLSRRGNLPFVLRGHGGVAAVTAFQHALAVALEKAGFAGATKSNFAAHVTLLYDGCRVLEKRVEPVAWTVREFVLVHSSLLGRTRHVTIGRWPLLPAAVVSELRAGAGF